MSFPRWTLLLLALIGLPCVSMAEGIGAVSRVRSQPLADGAPAWTIDTEGGVRMQVEFPDADIVRIRAGRNGQLPVSKDQAAPIVLPQPARQLAVAVEEESSEIRFRTAALQLRIQRAPLRLSLDRIENGKAVPLWQELQPLELDERQSVQVLSSSADERFFGGGQQNGRFQFKGRELDISYSGGWEEGDRPNPAPMLLSSRGWGMLRNTWADGSYDLRQPDQSTLLHQEDGFDAYFFVGEGLPALLERYTALTGRAGLLPRWALSYGDADCYNDGDNRKKPGTVPEGWSDGPTGTTPDVVQSVAAKYREHDMPGGWILPNDGYGCGYTDLPRTVQELAKHGFRTGLWTEDGVDKIAWESEVWCADHPTHMIHYNGERFLGPYE